MFSKALEKNEKNEGILRELSNAEGVNGGTTTLPCVGITVTISVSMCPTTKCTSQC
ncbi:class II lanthipeptide, LchA2/BrtA2 family [Bacillus massilinigeriensis]|uniref:class II lanthipeptide, LchA2/BrtA2 family n=1 Tax=Bacillus mediterraneensis TaxID=1805474 RepID=UPI00190E9DC9|nr:class II lanthipeptide, LchA2/BrtA2 family [Bacillus mediterraneensis]